MKIICLLILVTACIHVYSESKTFIREYTYTAGDADSKLTSQIIALESVKRVLLNE